MNDAKLPILRDLSRDYMLSFLVAALMAAASLAGLFFQGVIYPDEALRHSFISNDVVNLLIGLPILFASMALARRGKLIGLLFWPGALLYVTYNYIAYAVAMPFTWQFILYLVLAALSGFSVYRLLTAFDTQAIARSLSGKVPERFAGAVLAGFGLLFFAMRVGVVLGGQGGPEAAVAVADLFTMPFWVIGGVLLWRKRPFGYASGAGLLFQASMLFIGLLVFFILQPLVAGVPFPVEDFVVIAVMGLVCFVPFGLFVRGILRA
ncbi:MAG: hypothetical protein CVU44_13855 [Chloroflexi bacterium HGW-Chloroflexi-6]|nr:MAG: hypothetical protein CVU44_13855 [Chloroflexi bacterium HGW-Chloroflexi-6]